MDITKEINDYILTPENNGALLVTGNWGCGKTYILKQFLEETNKGTKFLVVLISLFGIESIDSLTQTVKESVFFSQGFGNNSDTIKKGASTVHKVFSKIGDLASEYSNIAKGINTALTIKWQDFVRIESEVKCIHDRKSIEKRLVLIFDDFERRGIDIVKLMGAINDFSENKNIKVIIVADENHISDDKYNEFKEKLISRTVKLIPDHENTIRSIVGNYKEVTSGYRDFLNDNLPLIIELFYESKTYNLRSLKSFLMDFERAYAVWTKYNIPKTFLSNVFYDFGAMLFTAKAGQYTENKYGDLFGGNEFAGKYKHWSNTYKLNSLKFWILNGFWDEDVFIDEITQKFGIINYTTDQKFLKFDFWGLEQENIINGMPIVLEKAYKGELTRESLVELFQKISVMRKYNIPFPCEIDFEKIYEGFAIRKEKILSSEIIEPRLHRSLHHEEIPEECITLYENIAKFDDYLETYYNKQKVLDYLKPDTTISEYSLNGLIVGYLDDQLLEHIWTAFVSGNNSKKRDLMRVILNLRYNDSFYTNPKDMPKTISNLNELIKRLNELKSGVSDCITIVIINDSIKAIKELLEEISCNSKISQ